MRFANFKPLLSATLDPKDLDLLNYPVLVSSKLDGIRCIMVDGKAVSRKLKPIPNVFVREWLEACAPPWSDGEITLRDPIRPFADVSSAIMSRDGEPDFVFRIFDMIPDLVCPPTELVKQIDYPFEARFRHLVDYVTESYRAEPQRFTAVPHVRCNNVSELMQQITINQEHGYEGTMIRSLHGPYKFGRSTAREGTLLKIKSFADEEAIIVAVEPWKENHNPQERDALGHAKRSSAQDGKVAIEQLGALTCVCADRTQFSVGGGFTLAQRTELWKDKKNLLGKIIKFKHQPPPGGRKKGEAPRFPVFLGFRED